MNPELETIKYLDITSVRTNHKLIFDPFKEIVKQQGLDVCFVTNNFWRAYQEAYELGKVEMPTSNTFPSDRKDSHDFSETSDKTVTPKEAHYHTHLHLHTSYVVDRPRRRKNLADIPYICEAKDCTNTAEFQATHKNGKPYKLCPTHMEEYKPFSLTVQPLRKVNISNTMNGEEKQQSDEAPAVSTGNVGVTRGQKISLGLKRMAELKRLGRRAQRF